MHLLQQVGWELQSQQSCMHTQHPTLVQPGLQPVSWLCFSCVKYCKQHMVPQECKSPATHLSVSAGCSSSSTSFSSRRPHGGLTTTVSGVTWGSHWLQGPEYHLMRWETPAALASLHDTNILLGKHMLHTGTDSLRNALGLVL